MEVLIRVISPFKAQGNQIVESIYHCIPNKYQNTCIEKPLELSKRSEIPIAMGRCAFESPPHVYIAV
jgi:hypothetical protein